MGCTPAPACRAALAEATRLWPNRRKTSDGICGDPRHQARVSDHNAGNAWDLSHDPAQGCNAHLIVERVRQRRDPRVKYIISNGRICGPGSRGGGWDWKRYTGSNPHTQHSHVSIWPSARNDTRPWIGDAIVVPAASGAPPPQTAANLGKRAWPGLPCRVHGGYCREHFSGKQDGNVYWIQWVIAERTNYSGPMRPDWDFGPLTEAAVKGFQGAQQLSVDGIVGPRTWDRLNRFA